MTNNFMNANREVMISREAKFSTDVECEVSDIRIVGFKTASECKDGLLVLSDVEMVGLITDEKGRKLQARGFTVALSFRQVQGDCDMCKDGIDERRSKETGLTYFCQYCGGSKIRNL
jgi:hypothetical protein